MMGRDGLPTGPGRAQPMLGYTAVLAVNHAQRVVQANPHCHRLTTIRRRYTVAVAAHLNIAVPGHKPLRPVRPAVYIYPIDNFDEMRERVAETLFSPENISKMGPYWQFENIGSELTSCMAYARSMESYMKLTEHPDLEIPPIQTMREMLLTWERY